MKVTKATIVRTILTILVIVNIVLQRLGYDVIDVGETEVGMILELVIEIAILVVGFWKNNSYSKKAIMADKFLKTLRDGTELNEEGDEE